jgi:hypothetical protein
MKEIDQQPSDPPTPPDSTVELVGFGPSLSAEGRVAPSVADALAQARRKRIRLIVLGGVILVVVAGILWGPDAYRAAKTMRAASLARTAEDQVRDNDVDGAIATIRSAYLMAPNDSEVLRGMAQTLSALTAPSAMTYWNWLLASSAVTLQDRRDAAECALQLGLYTQAGTIIGDLLKANPKSAADLLLAARYFELAGDPAQSVQFAQQSIAADPSYAPAIIFFAAAELSTPASHQAGVDALLKVAARKDDFGLIAIQRLSQDVNLKPAELQEAYADLQAHPSATEAERITQLVLQIRLNPSQRTALLDQAVAAHANVSTDDLRQFSTWLNTVGESRRVLTLIPKDKAIANRNLFLTYLDALGALKDWPGMTDLLTGSHVPLEQPYVELYLYRCAREMNDTENANLHWRSAQVAAAHNPRQSLYLAGYAEQLGDGERAEPIYRSLTKDLMAGRPAYLGLLRIDGAKDTTAARNLLDEMAARWPDDEAINNDDVYFNLLLNTNVPQMYNRAVALAKADIHSAPHLTDVALAYLRLNKPQLALTVFNEGNIQWTTASPAMLAVYAAALEGNGQATLATQIADIARRTGALRPEEKALIQEIP